MEEEIEEKLNEIYNFGIDVKYREYGLYDIYCSIPNDSFCIPIIYISNLTLEGNITNIINKIDGQIVKLFKKGIF